MSRLDEGSLKRIGEQFGAYLSERINQALSHTVVVLKVTDEYADVAEFDDDPPIRVPLLCLNAGSATLKIKPTVYSTAVILYTEGDVNRPVFVGFTEVDEIVVRVGESSVQISDKQIVFNEGEKSGLVLADKLKDKLNAIENDLNSLKAIFSSWQPIPNDGGSSLKADASGWAAQRLIKTKVTDIENDKIKQSCTGSNSILRMQQC